MNLTEIILGSYAFIISCFVKVLWSNHDAVRLTAEKNQQDLSDFKLYVAKDHATKANLTEVILDCKRSYEAVFRILDEMRAAQPEQFDKLRRDIHEMSEQFRDKLDKKADKPV